MTPWMIYCPKPNPVLARYIEALRNPDHKQLFGGIVSGEGGGICALSLARRVLSSEGCRELFSIVSPATVTYLNDDVRLTFPQIATWLLKEYPNAQWRGGSTE